jgi:hypothetical protein
MPCIETGKGEGTPEERANAAKPIESVSWVPIGTKTKFLFVRKVFNVSVEFTSTRESGAGKLPLTPPRLQDRASRQHRSASGISALEDGHTRWIGKSFRILCAPFPFRIFKRCLILGCPPHIGG